MANRVDPDQTLPHQEQSDLGLHCLSKGILKDSRRRQMQMFSLQLTLQGLNAYFVKLCA